MPQKRNFLTAYCIFPIGLDWFSCLLYGRHNFPNAIKVVFDLKTILTSVTVITQKPLRNNHMKRQLGRKGIDDQPTPENIHQNSFA